jgi:hypothetical protein
MVHHDVISVAIENLNLGRFDIDSAYQQADRTFPETAEIHILL